MVTYPSSAYDKWRTTPPEPKQYSYNVKVVVEIEMVVKATSEVEALENCKQRIDDVFVDNQIEDYEISGTVDEWQEGE